MWLSPASTFRFRPPTRPPGISTSIDASPASGRRPAAGGSGRACGDRYQTMAAFRRALPVAALALPWSAFAVHALAAQQVAWEFFNNWLYNTLIVLACGVCLLRAIVKPAERFAWLLLATGLSSW